MKIRVAKDSLSQAVNAVNPIVPAKSTMPVLFNILFEAEGRGEEGFLKLSATDLDISLSYRIKAEVEGEGAITVPARKLAEIVRELPNAPITIEKQGERVSIVCGRASFLLPGLPKADYPALPQRSFEGAFRIDNQVMRKLVATTSYATGKDDDRPILKGVLWEVGPEESSMVGTNGHRLAKMVCKGKFQVGEHRAVVVPPKAMELVEKLMSPEGQVEVAIEGNHLGMRENDVVVFCRLIEGTYPNYEQVIPFYNGRIAILNTAPFIEALRRMLILANAITHRVRLHFEDGKVDISVRTEELGEGQETLEVDFGFEPLDIYFNGNYLLDVLKYIEGDQVKLCMQTSESGILMVPAVEAEGQRYLNVIMPLKVTE